VEPDVASNSQQNRWWLMLIPNERKRQAYSTQIELPIKRANMQRLLPNTHYLPEF
jgi:hypothetical protein